MDFKQVTPCPSKVVNVAYSVGCDLWSTNPPIQKYKKVSGPTIKWKPRDINFAKLNFDGVVSHCSNAAIGFIIQDSGVKKSRSLSVPITKALSLCEGLLTVL